MFTAEKPDLEQAYLSHYGRKGMKWGVRSRRVRTPQQQIARRKKAAIGAAVVAVGAVAAAFVLTRRGGVPVKRTLNMPRSFRSMKPDFGKDFLPESKGGFLNNINRRPAAGSATVRNMAQQSRASGSAAATAATGKAASSNISRTQWKQRVNALSDDIAGANREQDSYMRKLGLGAASRKATSAAEASAAAQSSSVYANRLKRAGLKTNNVNMGDLSDVRRALNDPNHVWEL